MYIRVYMYRKISGLSVRSRRLVSDVTSSNSRKYPAIYARARFTVYACIRINEFIVGFMKSLLHLAGTCREGASRRIWWFFVRGPSEFRRYNFNSLKNNAKHTKATPSFRPLFFCRFFIVYFSYRTLYVQYKLFNFCFKSYHEYRLRQHRLANLRKKLCLFCVLAEWFCPNFYEWNLIKQNGYRQ